MGWVKRSRPTLLTLMVAIVVLRGKYNKVDALYVKEMRFFKRR